MNKEIEKNTIEELIRKVDNLLCTLFLDAIPEEKKEALFQRIKRYTAYRLQEFKGSHVLFPYLDELHHTNFLTVPKSRLEELLLQLKELNPYVKTHYFRRKQGEKPL